MKTFTCYGLPLVFVLIPLFCKSVYARLQAVQLEATVIHIVWNGISFLLSIS
jgi:hypothetical protein